MGYDTEGTLKRIDPVSDMTAVQARILQLESELARLQKQLEAGRADSEERFRVAVSAAQLGVFEWDLQTGLAHWENDRIYEIFGREREDGPIGRDEFYALAIEPVDKRPLEEALTAAAKTSDAFRAAFRIRRQNDGQLRWIEASGRLSLAPDGTTLRLLGVVSDITEQKQAREAAEAHQQLLATVVSEIPASVSLIRGVDLRLQFFNAAYQAFAPGKAMAGKTLDEIWPETGRDFSSVCRRVLETGEPYLVVDDKVQIRRHPDAPIETAYFTWSMHRVRLPGDGGLGILNAAWETTKRKKSEEALRQSEERLRLAAESAHFGTWDADLVAGTLYLSTESRENLGAGDTETTRRMMLQSHDPSGDGTILDEHRIIRPDGAARWVQFRGQTVFEGEGAARRAIRSRGIVLDVTERKEAEERLQRTIDSITDGVFILDSNGRCTFLSETGAKMIGMRQEDLIGAVVWELFPSAVNTKFYTEYHRAVKTGLPVHFEEYFPKPLNMCLEVHAYPSPDGLVVYFRDTTQSRAVGEQLRQKNEELEQLMNVVPVAIWASDDPDCAQITGNRMANALYEAEEDENVSAGPASATGTPTGPRRFFSPDGRELSPAELPMQRAAANNIEIRNEEVEILLPSGRRTTLMGSASPLLDAEGKVRGTLGAFLDVTPRKRAERALRQSEELYRSLFENLREEVSLWRFETSREGGDGSWMLVEANPQALRTWNKTADEVRGRTPHEIVGPETAARFLHFVEKVMSENQPLTTDEYVPGIDRFYRFSGVALGNLFLITAADLTVTRKAHEGVEAARQEAEAQRRLLDAILESIPAGIIIADASGRLLRWNKANENLWGLHAADPSSTGSVADYKDWKGWWPQTGRRIEPEEWAMSRALLKREIVDGELVEIERFDGTDRRFVVNMAAPVEDESGNVVAGVVVQTDVTDRVGMERALRQSEARFRTLADNMSQFAWMADATGWIYWYNRRWFEYTGTTLEEMQGWGWRSVHDPDHIERVIKRFQHSLDTGEPWEDTFPLRGRNGEWHWFLSRALPIRDESGTILTWFGTNTDITEQLAAEKALRESEAQFRQIADSMPQLVWVTGAGGQHQWHNAQWNKYTGLSFDAGSDTRWLTAVHPEEQGSTNDRWQQSLKTGETFESELRCRRFDGSYRWFLGRALPIRDEPGAIVQWFATFTDIEGQKATEEALRRSNDDLQQFAYVASHDLQEPLRTVVAFSQMLARRHAVELDKDARECLGFIEDAGQHMSNLVRDLLAYSHATSDGNRVMDRVELDEVLQDSLGLLRGSLDAASAHVSADRLPVVRGDRGQLGQVLQNLLSNSVKYGRSGVPPRISIRCERTDFEWLISVRDNGQGFSQEYAHKIFGIFKRLHGKSVPGTGIGLAICKTVIERHGGRIWAESDAGRGAAFYFTLPV